MTDETFERFRRKLADVVTVAINEGHIVRSVGDTQCPVGCHPRAGVRRPTPFEASILFGVPHGAAKAFTWAFDGQIGSIPSVVQFPKYAELGRLYRARFP